MKRLLIIFLVLIVSACGSGEKPDKELESIALQAKLFVVSEGESHALESWEKMLELSDEPYRAYYKRLIDMVKHNDTVEAERIYEEITGKELE